MLLIISSITIRITRMSCTSKIRNNNMLTRHRIILIKSYIKFTRTVLKSAKISPEKKSIFSIAHQHLSNFISAYSTGVSTFLSLSARTVKLSDFHRVFRGRKNLSAIYQCAKHKESVLFNPFQ